MHTGQEITVANMVRIQLQKILRYYFAHLRVVGTPSMSNSSPAFCSSLLLRYYFMNDPYGLL